MVPKVVATIVEMAATAMLTSIGSVICERPHRST